MSAKPPARAPIRPRRGETIVRLSVLTLLLGFGSATAVGEAGLRAAVASASEQIDALRARSPGLRIEANTTKGKPRALARALPTERGARSSIVAPVPGALPGPIAAPAVTAPAAIASPLVAPVEGTTGSAVVPGGGGVFAGGPSGFLGPIGGGIGGIGGIGGGGGGIVVLPPGPPGTTPGETTPETPGPVVVAPPPAIPEPAGWALLILGFGTTGAVLRGRAKGVLCTSPARR